MVRVMVVFGVGVGVRVTVGVFDDDVQPHIPMINAAMIVTNTANVNGFISTHLIIGTQYQILTPMDNTVTIIIKTTMKINIEKAPFSTVRAVRTVSGQKKVKKMFHKF